MGLLALSLYLAVAGVIPWLMFICVCMAIIIHAIVSLAMNNN